MFAYQALHTVQACVIALSSVDMTPEMRTGYKISMLDVARFIGRRRERCLTSNISTEFGFSSLSAVRFRLVISTSRPRDENAFSEWTSSSGWASRAAGLYPVHLAQMNGGQRRIG